MKQKCQYHKDRITQLFGMLPCSHQIVGLVRDCLATERQDDKSGAKGKHGSTSTFWVDSNQRQVTTVLTVAILRHIQTQ